MMKMTTSHAFGYVMFSVKMSHHPTYTKFLANCHTHATISQQTYNGHTLSYTHLVFYLFVHLTQFLTETSHHSKRVTIWIRSDFARK